MCRGWPTACLVLAVLTADVRGEEDRWSRPATPERRQGDWVPLTCANCRPIGDQGIQATHSLPSVLTPPPRVEEARLLPPPPPPDGLFQQAATGFLEAFTQQQSQRKPQQFLQETTSQSISRPSSEFLKATNAPVNARPQQFVHEPSADFQVPQQINSQQSNRQPQLLQFSQQQIVPDNGPYLNQPLFIGPQFLAAPFFPQNPQNIQPINPSQIQPQAPILPNAVPVNKQKFQIPADRPVFVQQITTGNHEPPSAPQQVIPQTTTIPQQQYSVNTTDIPKGEGEKEEVQLLYVPVETLNQRARNLGRTKSLPSNQQDVTAQKVSGEDSNRFTSPGQNYQFSTRKPHLEDQENFNTQTHTSKHHYNIRQNIQHQQQLPPEDQEKFNTQTHAVRQQFNIKEQTDQFQRQVENGENVKLEPHITKHQYNFKQNDKTQQDERHLHSQFNIQQNSQFQQQPSFENSENVQVHNNKQVTLKDQFHQQDQRNFNTQTHRIKQPGVILNDQFQQQTQQDQANFNAQALIRQQHGIKSNDQFPHSQHDQANFNGQSHNIRQQHSTQLNSQFQPQTSQDEINFNAQPHIRQQQGIPLDQFHQQRQQDPTQTHNIRQQHGVKVNDQFQQHAQQDEANFNPQIFNANQQFNIQQNGNNFHQQLPQGVEENINIRGQTNKQQLHSNQNTQFQQQIQVNQQGFTTSKGQPYLNQPILLDQTLSTEQAQIQQQVSTQQTQPQQQFDQPETHQQTASPITQTRIPDVYTTQQTKKQRFRNSQQDATRNVQQIQNNQFTRQFPQDYQEATVVSDVPSAQNIESIQQIQNVRQNKHQTWSNQENSNRHTFNQQDISNPQYNTQETNQFNSNHHQISTISPLSSTLPPPQTTPTPNQPPLSVYMETTENTKVNDVLRLLKNAKTIQVLDTVGPESPQVFVGPSNLKAPTGYIKFELPYLNSLDSNRVERKVDKIPFFVAPLNFNPPPGYSKIPFPAPHIGSVVVSNVTVLKTALHEKPYENEPVTIHQTSSERYLDQFTLPAEIAPISPQLPSLINSLQDDVYSTPSTTDFPSTTTETTTTAYTTPLYRGRGSSRGSHRGSSSYTSVSPTRRSQSRTRRPYDGRPYSRRQPITTTTTTTQEPSTEPTVQQQYTPQPEQLAFNSEAYIQNTAAPAQIQAEGSQQKLQSDNPNSYYNEHIVTNNFNRDQFALQQQQFNQPIENQNIQQVSAVSNEQNIEQFHQNTEVSQNNYAVEAVAHTTAIPTVAIPDVQQEEHTFKSQRTSSSRRDPSRLHQRFRGRQRLMTTTTTENYEEPVQPIENHFDQQVDVNTNYQNFPSRTQLRNHNQQRLVENVHFEANGPQNKFNAQTERADIGFQTTERLHDAQNEGEQTNKQSINKEQFNSQLNIDNQFQQPTISHVSDPNTQLAGLQYQFQQSQAQFAQPNKNLEQSNTNVSYSQDQFNYVPASQQNTQSQYSVNQFQEVSSHGELFQQPIHSQEPQANFHKANLDQARSVVQIPNQVQQSYSDQVTHQKNHEEQPTAEEQSQTFNHQQFTNNQQVLLPTQEQIRDSVNINHRLQVQPISTSSKFEQVSEVTVAPQETPVQTPESEVSHPQIEESQVQQYNQQRLQKYNRPHNRTPALIDNPSTEEQTTNIRRGQYQYQANVDNSDISTTEAAITKSSLVRVRGRVRSRQRGSTRNYQTTTTEAPNYPTTYLSRQRNNQEREESIEYTPRKRVNYNRQSYSSLRNSNKEVNPDHNIAEINYASTEKQSTSERFLDYTDVSTTTTTTTTTTEASTSKPLRRYQHILNRNKVRRTRPTSSPSSGSSGTTKFLLPTTQPPITRLPSSRGRIRKPGTTTTTTSTTEYPQVNPNWNERDNFAPSAGSNEILEPLYQTRDKVQPSFGFQHSPVASRNPQKNSPKPAVASSNDDDFWNQAVTIQQSTSFDFKPSSVTPSSFQENNDQFQGTFSPIWNGQIELQDGNYYNIFNQQQENKNINDQTPFSSDQQKVVYKEIKSRRPIGKENQYTEKAYEVKKPTVIDEEDSLSSERIYPVYREIIKPAESIQDETSQVIVDPYQTEGKSLHEKDIVEHSEHHVQNEDISHVGAEDEIKEGALKRKIIATNPGKKGGRRRGSWVRVRVRKPQPDMFETAESQNLASLSENAIQTVTKSLNDKAEWTPDPSTEPPQTTTFTTAEAVTEPAETINFEEALKDMLKEFITNPEEENEEEAETEASTSTSNPTDTTNTTVTTEELNTREDEAHVQTDSSEKNTQAVTSQNEETENLNSAGEEYTVKQEEESVKTVIPEVTTELITQEPVTVFQTTLAPEVTTASDEPSFKTQNSRILGTSTTTEISLETEICYRGRCVKTKKGDSDSDLLTTE